MSASNAVRATRPAPRHTSRATASWEGAGQARPSRPRRGEPRRAERSEATARPRLSVVQGLAASRSTLPFLLGVVFILVAVLVSSMALNAAMADTAYRMQAAQVQLGVANDHVATLADQVQKASSPSSLTQAAQRLGMVPSGAPGVVDLTTSIVSGGTPAAEK